jgi:two-component system OmpR family response regulator
VQRLRAPFILVVEDDDEIGGLVAELLDAEGYDVERTANGVELDRVLARRMPDAILLDLMLPGEDGLTICRRLHAQGGPPVVIMTAKGDPLDRVVGLEIGADDYVVKPFHPRELIARIRAVLRRAQRAAAAAAAAPTDLRRFAGLTLDLKARRLADESGEEIVLSSGEYELLLAFIEHPQRILTRDQLLDWTKGRAYESFDRSIDVALSRLRRKIEPDASAPSLIRTVRNGGYMLAVPVKRG